MPSVIIEWTDGTHIEIGVGSMPGRKQRALYVTRGCQIEPLAWFPRDDDADSFMDLLYLMADKLEASAAKWRDDNGR